MLDKSLEQNIRELVLDNEAPFYLLDFDAIKSSFLQFSTAWKEYFPCAKVAYSYKSNSQKSVTQFLRQLGSCAEAVSGTELKWALEDGYDSDELFFNGPLKTDDELEFALGNNIRIQLDSYNELERLLALEEKMGEDAEISIRLASIYKGAHDSRFGVTKSEFEMCWKLLKAKKKPLSGIHMHVGSNLPSPDLHVETIRAYSEEIVRAYNEVEGGFWIDIGGGFPAKSIGKNVTLPTNEAFPSAICSELKKLSIDTGTVALVVEPGRCLVEDAGYLVTTIRAQKKRAGNRMLIADIGGHLIRSLHSWYHPIYQIAGENQSKTAIEPETVSIYGYNCFERDVLIQQTSGSKLTVGDILVFGSCGSYDIQGANAWIRGIPPILGVYQGSLFSVRSAQEELSIRKDQHNLAQKVEDEIHSLH